MRRRLLRALLACLVLFFAALAPVNAHAGDWYASIGLAMHAEALDAPEISGLDNPLLDVELGYRARDGYRVALRHNSSLVRTEAGYGFNMLVFKKTFSLSLPGR